MEKSVPKVITLAVYRLDAKAENPHWGMIPRVVPSSGPYLFTLVNFSLLFILCSINSIIKNEMNKKGISFNESKMASNILSIILVLLS